MASNESAKFCDIRGEMMLTRQAAHAELKRALRLPDYYGNNLDALWDLASTMAAEAVLRDAPAMLNALGEYGCKLLETLYQAANENPLFRFRVA